MELVQLGWRQEFESYLQALGRPELEPARVVTQHRGGYKVCGTRGDLSAEVSGRLRHEVRFAADFPTVGDWVAVEPLPAEAKCVIQAVLPRRTKFSRTAAGEAHVEQVLAANLDDVFVVAALTLRVNLRRLERYLSLAQEGGAEPLVVLTKADLCADVPAALERVAVVARGIPVYAVSSQTGEGLTELGDCLRPGRTVALFGPSGVGKTTLINRWYGEAILEVQPVREADQKGRHTTTRRQLFCLPSGALVIDTPGMRELQLWEGAEGVAETFSDVSELAGQCRFADCRHETEPGCAVLEAVRAGLLDLARFESHQKLQRESAYFERKHDKRAQAEQRKRIKAIHKGLRSFQTGQDKTRS